jgi:hypothetical protein
MLRLVVRGFVQVFPVAFNTALIAHGHLWPLFVVGYWISWWWRRNARAAAYEFGGITDHAYALGAGFGSIAGPALVAWWIG